MPVMECKVCGRAVDTIYDVDRIPMCYDCMLGSKMKQKESETVFGNALNDLRGAYVTARHDERVLGLAIELLEELGRKHTYQIAEAILRRAHDYLAHQIWEWEAKK